MPAYSPKRRLFRWIAYLLVGFLSLVIALVCAGAIYEALENLRGRRLYPPPGQLVEIGAYRLQLYCIGAGSPTVILEAGGGNPWLSWCKGSSRKWRASAGFVRIDRAGLGWSDPSPRPRTAKVIAEELHTLLHNAGITGPFVLVGHSLGGMDARRFANQYSTEVAGVVWWTPRIPNDFRRRPKSLPPVLLT